MMSTIKMLQILFLIAVGLRQTSFMCVFTCFLNRVFTGGLGCLFFFVCSRKDFCEYLVTLHDFVLLEDYGKNN